MHRLSIREARRIAIRAQLLDLPRPTELLAVVRRLGFLQLDPTAAIAPAADLVLWTRLGSSYAPADLVRALEARDLVELRALVRPIEDVALYRAEMDQWARDGELGDWRDRPRAWLAANHGCRADVLRRLEADGPLPSRDLPDTCAVPWTSTGWTHNKNITQLLGVMARRGDVAIAGRRGPRTVVGSGRSGLPRSARGPRARSRAAT